MKKILLFLLFFFGLVPFLKKGLLTIQITGSAYAQTTGEESPPDSHNPCDPSSVNYDITVCNGGSTVGQIPNGDFNNMLDTANMYGFYVDVVETFPGNPNIPLTVVITAPNGDEATYISQDPIDDYNGDGVYWVEIAFVPGEGPPPVGQVAEPPTIGSSPDLFVSIPDVSFPNIAITEPQTLPYVNVLPDPPVGAPVTPPVAPPTTAVVSNFNKYIGLILLNEGGWVDDPDDAGGKTNKGITFNSFQLFAQRDLGIAPTEQNLRNLTKAQASAIYQAEYWDKIHLDDVNNASLSYAIFDFYVNSGSNAVKSLQRAINSLLPATGPITVNGILGTQTINAMNGEDAGQLFNAFQQNRYQFYLNIIARKPSQIKFKKSWFNRTQRIIFHK